MSGHARSGRASSTVDWELLGGGTGTLVLLMAVTHLARSPKRRNAAGGRRRPGGRRRVRNDTAQRTVTAPPAITIVGDVVALRDLIA